mgnify:CR=1 FL=1
MEHIDFQTDDELDAAMRHRGLHCYREYFRWGKMAAYRNDDATVFRFVDRGDILSPAELLSRLMEEWIPKAEEDQLYRAFFMRYQLMALEKSQVATTSQTCERKV